MIGWFRYKGSFVEMDSLHVLNRLIVASDHGPTVGHFPLVATSYSTLAGVLAGFAFLCLITIAVSPTESRWQLNAAPPMTASFVGLVLVSANYAVIAGENEGTPRVASLEIFAGLGFTVSGLMLPYVLVVLLEGTARNSQGPGPLRASAAFLRFCIGFAAPLFALFDYSALSDALGPQRSILSQSYGWLHIACLVIVALLVANSVLAGARRFKTWSIVARTGLWFKSRSRKSLWRLSQFSVTLGLVSIVLVQVTILFIPEDSSLGLPWVCATWMAFAVFGWLVTWSAMTYEADTVTRSQAEGPIGQ